MRTASPLSYLDPARSARYFQEFLEKLESDGIVLVGMIYYSWTGDSQFDADRCGGHTDSGRAALSPL